MILIGLGHKKRTGKDTLAAHFKEQHGFHVLSFAGTLKSAVKEIYRWSDAHVHGELKEVVDPFWNTTPRKVLQRFGTEACRDVMDKDIWIKSMHKQVLDIVNDDPDARIVIPDTRFPNEAKWIKSMGGKVWKINRPIDLNEFSTHQSEVALDHYNDWDLVIENIASLEALYVMGQTALEEVLNEPSSRPN